MSLDSIKEWWYYILTVTTKIDLSPSISAHVTHFSPIKAGSDFYRIIYEVYSDPTQKSFLLKFYEIWISQEYVADNLRLSRSATREEILDFANNYLIKRYKDSGNNVPVEGGALLTNTTGEVKGDPNKFPYQLDEDKKPELVKTTIMLPKETHKELTNYAHSRNISMGEAVRLVVGGFLAGTATVGGSEEPVKSEGGIPPLT